MTREHLNLFKCGRRETDIPTVKDLGDHSTSEPILKNLLNDNIQPMKRWFKMNSPGTEYKNQEHNESI